MKSFVVFIFLVSFLLCCSTLVIGAPDSRNDGKSLDAFSKRKQTALWFGPRLGRKKRNPQDQIYMLNLDEELIDAVMTEAAKENPIGWYTMNEGGKRHVVNFTPRLGRESGEDIVHGGYPPTIGRWTQDIEAPVADYLVQRAPFFVPRLGRRIHNYLPEGREIEKVSV